MISKKIINLLITDQLAQVALDFCYLEQFVDKYHVELIAIHKNNEGPNKSELMYFFDDNLGGYNIKGIKNSLDGKVYYL
jgi:hypothetical protein